MFAQLAIDHIKKQLRKAGMREYLEEDESFRYHYYDTGSTKAPLLLLNGLGASTEFQWYKVVPYLTHRFRIILVNLPYFGQSSTLATPALDLEEQQAYLHHLLQRLELSSTTLAGISYGGLVAAEYAEQYPSQVKHLVLINTPIKFLELAHVQQLCAKHGIPSVADFFAPKDHKGFKKQFQLAYFRPPYMPQFVLKGLYQGLCAPYTKHWGPLINDLIAKNDILRNRQYTYAGPTVVLWGQYDQIIPLEVGQQLAKEYAHATLKTVDRCGHLPPVEQPKWVAAQLNAL